MKKTCLLLFLFATAMFTFSQAPEDDLKKIITQQETDWNNNDINAFARAFSEDATLINFLGMYWKGRGNISEEFSKINDCCIKPTSVKYEWIDSKFLHESVAVAHSAKRSPRKKIMLFPADS